MNDSWQRRRIGKLRRHDHRRCLGLLQLLPVPRVGEKGNAAFARRKKAANLRHDDRSITFEYATETRDDLV